MSPASPPQPGSGVGPSSSTGLCARYWNLEPGSDRVRWRLHRVRRSVSEPRGTPSEPSWNPAGTRFQPTRRVSVPRSRAFGPQPDSFRRRCVRERPQRPLRPWSWTIWTHRRQQSVPNWYHEQHQGGSRVQIGGPICLSLRRTDSRAGDDRGVALSRTAEARGALLPAVRRLRGALRLATRRTRGPRSPRTSRPTKRCAPVPHLGRRSQSSGDASPPGRTLPPRHSRT
jgi:hypothetical protein